MTVLAIERLMSETFIFVKSFYHLSREDNRSVGGGENGTSSWTCGVRPDLGSAIWVLVFWLGKNSEARLRR